MHEIIIPSLTQLVWQSPVLLVYLVGIILALVFWRRHSGPCLLVLVAAFLLLFVAVTQTIATHSLIRAREELGWGHGELAWMLSAIGLVGSVLRALGTGLFVAAVFVGRRSAWPVEPSPPDHSAAPASPPYEEQGITDRPRGRS